MFVYKSPFPGSLEDEKSVLQTSLTSASGKIMRIWIWAPFVDRKWDLIHQISLGKEYGYKKYGIQVI